MSLESQIGDLVGATNQLTQAVSGKMGAIDAQVSGFVNTWGVTGYTILQVGPTRAFKNIPDAFYSLDGKSLKGDVLIKVDDGTYPTSGFTLQNQPHAHRIKIEGNVANPASCVIQMTPDANKQSHGVIFRNVRQIGFAGFKITGDTSSTHFTNRGLRLDKGAMVWTDANSIIIDGALNGIEIDDISFLMAEKVRVTNFGCHGAFVMSGSTFYGNGFNATGKGVNVITPHITTGAQLRCQAITCVDTARTFIANSVIANVYRGLYSNNAGYIYAADAQITTADIGVVADMNSSILATNIKITGAANKAVYASVNSMVHCSGAVALNCPVCQLTCKNAPLLIGNGV